MLMRTPGFEWEPEPSPRRRRRPVVVRRVLASVGVATSIMLAYAFCMIVFLTQLTVKQFHAEPTYMLK